MPPLEEDEEIIEREKLKKKLGMKTMEEEWLKKVPGHKDDVEGEDIEAPTGSEVKAALRELRTNLKREDDPLLKSFEIQQQPEFLLAFKGDHIPKEGMSFRSDMTDPAGDFLHLLRPEGSRVKILGAAMSREWDLQATKMRALLDETRNVSVRETYHRLVNVDYTKRSVKVRIPQVLQKSVQN